MKNTSRDWIQAAAARSGRIVTMPPTPVAAPPKRASDAWRRLAIWASSVGLCAYIRLRSSTHAAAAGACRSDAASAMCSGARNGSVRRRSRATAAARAGAGPSVRAISDRRHPQAIYQGRVSYCGSNGSQVVDPVVVCIATFMLLLDITIVNVALPAIERDLHASSPTCSG